MKSATMHSCHLGPEISPEQFIPEHFFMYVLKGHIDAYDGKMDYQAVPGDGFIARKNQLVRYTKHKDDGAFEKVVIVLDEPFLKSYQEKHPVTTVAYETGAIIPIPTDTLIENFISSLQPYFRSGRPIDPEFSAIKREELLLILLRQNPQLVHVFFNFGVPEKINLEAFMNRNFRFNVSLDRLALLTGRSLSAFKREFSTVFNDSPSRWLLRKRLEEARFLLEKKHQKPTEVYLQVGFEDLSHFSFAFKKKYGAAPSHFVRKSEETFPR